MIFKAFLLYPGACCMVGLVAMLGAGIELHLLHKDIRGKDRLGKFVFSTFWTTLFTCFFLKFSSVTKHFLYMDDVTAVRFLYGLIIAVLVATARIGFSAYLHKHAKPCTKEDKQHDLKPLGVIGVILFALGFSFFMLGHFIPATWGGITPEQMMVSTDVILQYLDEHHPGAKLYVVGTPALLRAFEKAGWTLDDEDPDVVILGFDTTLTYEKLSKLCTFVRHGKTYYGINPDLNCPVEGGEFIPDCGSIARCVESGDRMYTDIAVADNSDVVSILVLSGETKEEDVPKSKHQPDIMIENIGVLADLL